MAYTKQQLIKQYDKNDKSKTKEYNDKLKELVDKYKK